MNTRPFPLPDGGTVVYDLDAYTATETHDGVTAAPRPVTEQERGMIDASRSAIASAAAQTVTDGNAALVRERLLAALDIIAAWRAEIAAVTPPQTGTSTTIFNQRITRLENIMARQLVLDQRILDALVGIIRLELRELDTVSDVNGGG